MPMRVAPATPTTRAPRAITPGASRRIRTSIRRPAGSFVASVPRSPEGPASPPPSSFVAWNQPEAVWNPSVLLGPLPVPGASVRTAPPRASVKRSPHGSEETFARSCPASTCAAAVGASVTRTADATANARASTAARYRHNGPPGGARVHPNAGRRAPAPAARAPRAARPPARLAGRRAASGGRRRAAGPWLDPPPRAQHVLVAAADRHLLGVQVLEQGLGIAARGAELVANPRDRDRAVPLAEGDDPGGELGQRGRGVVEVPSEPHGVARPLERAQPLGGLRRVETCGVREGAVRTRLRPVRAKQLGEPKGGVVEGRLGSRGARIPLA